MIFLFLLPSFDDMFVTAAGDDEDSAFWNHLVLSLYPFGGRQRSPPYWRLLYSFLELLSPLDRFPSCARRCMFGAPPGGSCSPGPPIDAPLGTILLPFVDDFLRPPAGRSVQGLDRDVFRLRSPGSPVAKR